MYHREGERKEHGGRLKDLVRVLSHFLRGRTAWSGLTQKRLKEYGLWMKFEHLMSILLSVDESQHWQWVKIQTFMTKPIQILSPSEWYKTEEREGTCLPMNCEGDIPPPTEFLGL